MYWLVKPCLFGKLSLTVWQPRLCRSASIAASIFCIESNTSEAMRPVAVTLSTGCNEAEQIGRRSTDLLGHGSSQLFRCFQNHFPDCYSWDPEKSCRTLLSPCLEFLLSAFVCCAARVPRHVTHGVMYCNYPKGGSPEGELTAQFRSAEALSYLQAVLKILQQFPYIFYWLWSRLSLF